MTGGIFILEVARGASLGLISSEGIADFFGALASSTIATANWPFWNIF